jgi:heterodisulfide reductase subunit C
MRHENVKIPGRLSRTEEELKQSLLKQMETIPNSEKIKSCIQCGTCTGSCPVSYAMDYTTRELIALFRAGELELLLKSKAIWICASCYACQTRCPSDIKITDIIYALKRLAMEKEIYPQNFPAYTLQKTFVGVMNRYGRLHEPTLLVAYLLKTKPMKLLGFMPLGLRIDGIEGFKKIIKKAEQLDAPVISEKADYMKDAVGYGAVSNEVILETK